MSEPRVALITTTIHVPHALKLYREYGPDVQMFVAGDEKTPHQAVVVLMDECGLPLENYYSPEDQRKLGYACSELIGWNCIQRRNIATLEALKWGADIIVSVDDDNLPLDSSYFDRYIAVLHSTFSGPCIQAYNGWFDTSKLLVTPTTHRGFPHDIKSLWGVKPVVQAKVGVAAGLCLGNPDVSAITRIESAPVVYGASELAQRGAVVDPHTLTVYNTQNVAFTREFAPAMLLVPQFKRFDDILASMVCQRIMREYDAHVHVGQPFVFQDRNEHSLLQDLRDEMWGTEHILGFAQWLESPIGGDKLRKAGSVVEKVRALYSDLKGNLDIPEGVVELADAWCDDIEKVM